MREKKNAYRILVGKEQLRRSRRRWVDNIKIRWGGMDWIDLAQYRNWWRALVHMVMNIRVP
jgi:hypothetical protein